MLVPRPSCSASRQHPLLSGHHHGARWELSRADAEQLEAEFRASGGRTSKAGPGHVTDSGMQRRTEAVVRELARGAGQGAVSEIPDGLREKILGDTATTIDSNSRHGELALLMIVRTPRSLYIRCMAARQITDELVQEVADELRSRSSLDADDVRASG